MSIAVAMIGISKSFGAVKALSEVSLQVQAGEIHAVVGENGAGKTTLMRVLYGVHLPDKGTVEVDGAPRRFASSAEAIAAGIGMVSQHYGIIPELTCLQNLILGAEGGAAIDMRRAEERAESLAQRMGFQFNWHADAESLSPAGAQKLEILKLLWRDAHIMILDEPTAMLSPADGEALFESLQKLTAEGRTVILVTHRLPEVFQYCANVTVLRAGKLVVSCPVSKTTPADLAEMIVGRDLEPPAERVANVGEEVLRLEGLSAKDDNGHIALKDANLTLRAGEVVGIAGVDGSGQRELFQVLTGQRRPISGSANFLNLALLKLTPWERIENGLRLLPEDRHAEGVIEAWSLEENAALGLQRLPPFARNGWVDKSGRHTAAVQIAERFKTKFGAIKDDMASLSGGNQQRFVAARTLSNGPKLILAFQPARGLDLAATRGVYDGIREQCEKGATALIVSYDLDELLEHCDRVVVMNRGILSLPPAGMERDRDEIGLLMVAAN